MNACRHRELRNSIPFLSRLARNGLLVDSHNNHTKSSQKNVRSLHVEKLPRKGSSYHETKEIAVLGGGITGLTTAFFLTKELPNAKITVYEKSSRLGGWLESPVHDWEDGKVVFENGPRTLRQDLWNGHSTRALIEQLGLAEDIVSTSKRSPAASNRYIYYPDHLVRMPGPIPGAGLLSNISENLLPLFREPVFKGFLRSIFLDFFDERKRPRSQAIKDESVGDFISRRLKPSVADNMVSAVLHGIYAGDLYRLSARTLLPLIWRVDSEEKSVANTFMKMAVAKVGLIPRRLVELASLTWNEGSSKFDDHLKGNLPQLSDSSVFTFKRGLHQIVEKLETTLTQNPRVRLRRNANLEHLRKDQTSNGITLSGKTPKGPFTQNPNYIVSTLSSPAMSQLLTTHHEAASTLFSTYNSTVNVMVVNLFYPTPNLLAPLRGFGYLIPRSITYSQNPESALGVIFGSDGSVGQDTATGTKLTVMMGGHWWNGIPVSDLPDPDSAVKMARAVLERHLGITADPAITSAILQKDAIPQYEVGHHERMRDIHNTLITQFAGKVKLAGAWWTGVGVNDCTTAARWASLDIREGRDDRSGVEWFATGSEGREGGEWCTEDRRSGKVHWTGDWEMVALQSGRK